MRIAHVTATFPPHFTGTGMVCYHNALGLAKLDHEVAVFTARHPSERYSYPAEISVHRLPVMFRMGNAPFLPELLRLGGFDVVHLHYPFYFGAETVFLKSLTNGLKYVVTYHQDVLFAGPLRYLERFHHRLLGKRILSRAEKVLATSVDYARTSRIGQLMGEHPESVAELPNGVDALRFHPEVSSGDLRARYGLRKDDRLVLFVGALDQAHYFKGMLVLLRALSHAQDGAVRLLIVGDGNLRRTYQEQAAELGLSERVVFCGYVRDEELPAHYALCDLLVLPSTTMGEAF